MLAQERLTTPSASICSTEGHLVADLTRSAKFKIQGNSLAYFGMCEKCQEIVLTRVPDNAKFTWSDAPGWWNPKGKPCNRVDSIHDHIYLDYWRSGIAVNKLKPVID